MSIESQIENWKGLAEYDFDTAGVMLKTGRLLYVVFTCQQCIEKILKAIYVKNSKVTPPYTHNLQKLVSEALLAEKISEPQKKFIDRLNTFYIEGRYSEQLEELKSNLSEKTATEIYNDTKILYQWLKEQLN